MTEQDDIERERDEYREKLARFKERMAPVYDRLTNPNGGVWIGEGWESLVLELTEKIAEINPNFEITQVKEKFGGLRYYTGALPKEAFELIREAERLSLKTCETCGEPGERRGKYWVYTACDAHTKEE